MQEANALAGWMPPVVMAFLLIGALALLWRMFAARLDKMEATLDLLKDRLPNLATTDQLGRLGDRMDGRVTNVTERVAVLEALERRKGKDS